MKRILMVWGIIFGLGMMFPFFQNFSNPLNVMDSLKEKSKRALMTVIDDSSLPEAENKVTYVDNKKDLQREAEEKLEQPEKIEYVQIDQKWYRYNPANIYLINGEKVYYVDKSREARREELEKAKATLKENGIDISNMGADEILSNFGEILSQAKKNMVKRGHAMKEIESELNAH